ncbi:MAG: type II toxin-antitoxin system VapC family toxin [Chloroflexales bacterium]|nr:type II toxin-antitoxin system VapC family toxin [Chloroflexales bacterium]
MKLLLDTHTFLWFVNGDAKLSSPSRQLIEDVTNDRLISIASIWEMAIKVSTGRLQFDEPFAHFIPTQLQQNRIAILDITIAHTMHVAELPYHHRDPFDRLLIAQALVEVIPIVGADSAFDPYGITRLW